MHSNFKDNLENNRLNDNEISDLCSKRLKKKKKFVWHNYISTQLQELVGQHETVFIYEFIVFFTPLARKHIVNAIEATFFSTNFTISEFTTFSPSISSLIQQL